MRFHPSGVLPVSEPYHMFDNPRPRRPSVPRTLFATAVALVLLAEAAGATPDPLRMRVTLAPAAARGIAELGLDTPVTGRVYVILTRDDGEEPREQTGVTGVPFWGMDVRGLGPGDSVVLDTAGATTMGETSDGGVIGYPLPSFADIPPGEYWLQPVLNVYTRFERADGHVVELHLNSGAGQSPMRAPGNAYGTPIRVQIDPASGGVIDLTLDRVIPPIEPLRTGEVLQQGNPRDTERVKFVKIRSAVLSEFWGRDIYIGANVLLPAGYAEQPDRRYPTIWMQGHFPGRSAPLGYGSRWQPEFAEHWDSGTAPQVVAISIRDANPYYDTSYGVDSANVGPYGTAITTELMPYLEDHFRLIPEEWARVTAGGSTGGWEALAAQVFYPEVFGGAWGWCPDPVDFNYYQIVGVYEDDNAYTTGNEWHRVERPNTRRTDGNVTSTVRMENVMELAMGTRKRSAGQWAIWEAVFGPVADDGYPAPIWDPATGAIDREVAEYWRANFDLHRYLRTNWASVGPSLRGKLHVAVGDMDTYYLEQAVYLLEDFLGSVQDPPAEAEFQYGRREPHCWTGYSPSGSGEDMTNAEFVRLAAEHMASRAPAGADLGWLR